MKIPVLHKIDWRRLAEDSAPRLTTASVLAAVAEEKAAVAPRDPFEARGYAEDETVTVPKKQAQPLATLGDIFGDLKR